MWWDHALESWGSSETQISAALREANAVVVIWNDAAAYCNWLSERDGLPKEQWCYVHSNVEDPESPLIAAPNAVRRAGYRLPTETEWEFACRAGTDSKRYCGDALQWLSKYAWHYDSWSQRTNIPRAARVGQFKPNRFGLFDMLGNAQEWCHDVAGAVLETTTTGVHVARGGSYALAHLHIRATYRKPLREPQRADVGFRVVRTVP